ncbi:tRNA (N(6)-L-threonylcarbamoyladenosine(37)-C(2))-methylthiotransferase MtaB [Desulfobacterales bacterium HSG16]|nr:tRNA (N(6)-L-threonylcarbamoyladenosine(37)-C(2))-methylthiotransferase MtaB [Desulfobacterales bacterium HSG16]
MRFMITTLGCKVNQYESDAIAQDLKKDGWREVTDGPATVAIINTCTVTGKGSMQSRQAIRKVIRNNPGACIAVIGCYAQTEADEIKKIDGVHFVIGHGDKYRLKDILLNADQSFPKSAVSVCNDILKEKEFAMLPVVAHGKKRSRPFLKIQDGCSAFCSYCIVPYARGPSRSMEPAQVIEHLAALSSKGFKEVVVSGIHLGCYGLDLSNKTNLYELLCKIEDRQPIERIRLSSIEPDELSDEIIDLVAESDMFCPHFHIPLQSGDDMILDRMKRSYTSEFFIERVNRIHEKMPDAAIGADTLIGFPGESEEAFLNTFQTVKKLPLSYLHVFPFSPRENTPASKFSNKIPQDVIKARCRTIRDLSMEKRLDFYKSFLNKFVDILVLGESGGESEKKSASVGYLKGISSSYLPVLIPYKPGLKNSIVRVQIEKINGLKIFGNFYSKESQ